MPSTSRVDDHTGPIAAALSALSSARWCIPCTARSGARWGTRTSRSRVCRPVSGSSRCPGVSGRDIRDLPWVGNCPNAIDPSRYSWGRGEGDYLAFLGRMGHEKGCHHAIVAAKSCHQQLKIAAKCREPAELAYFAEYVEPHLGHGVEYLGEVGHDEEARAPAERSCDALPRRLG